MRRLVPLLGLALCAPAPAHAQEPAEPWRFHERLAVHPPLLEALNALFTLAAARDEAAFKARFTADSVARLEARWAQPDATGSWATMMAALVGKGGQAPDVVQVALDRHDGPTEATITVALDGRRHSLYLVHEPGDPIPWRVEVRERDGVFNLAIKLATKERSLAEISFGTGLGTPPQYSFGFDDDVKPSMLSSLWITAEFFPLPWLRLGAIYDLPLSFQVLEVRGETREQYVPSRLLLGVTWTPVYVDFGKASRLETQVLTYMGTTLDPEPEPVPMVAGRVAFLQNAYEGADIYLGAYYMGVINYIGLLYGVGYRF